MDAVSRREFLATGTLLLSTARSYSRILGANDRIQVGLIGCGHRSGGHRQMLKMSAETDPNFDVRSVCDLWSVNRERAADDVQKLFGKRPKTYQYSEEMLADPDLDAVMIATGDHQHARILAEVVRAGKDLLREADGEHTSRRQAGARRRCSRASRSRRWDRSGSVARISSA
jgi:hypothetical protein